MEELIDPGSFKITLNKAEDLVKEDDPKKSNLIKLFIRIRDISSERSGWIQDQCKELFMRDYQCKFMYNLNRSIPGVEVKILMIPVARNDGKENAKEMNSNIDKCLKHDLDPCFTRFPCPVILFNGKYICRAEYSNILKDDYFDEELDPLVHQFITQESLPENLKRIYRRIKIRFMKYPGTS